MITTNGISLTCSIAVSHVIGNGIFLIRQKLFDLFCVPIKLNMKTVFIMMGNSSVPPPFFGGVWYPLLNNLLYQVTKISHLMVPSSHCVVRISHITVLLSHSVVPLFYLTFDSTILILCSTNITCDCAFVTFGDSLNFFPHIWWYHPHIAQY